jgi:hypothetical protein
LALFHVKIKVIGPVFYDFRRKVGTFGVYKLGGVKRGIFVLFIIFRLFVFVLRFLVVVYGLLGKWLGPPVFGSITNPTLISALVRRRAPRRAQEENPFARKELGMDDRPE